MYLQLMLYKKIKYINLRLLFKVLYYPFCLMENDLKLTSVYRLDLGSYITWISNLLVNLINGIRTRQKYGFLFNVFASLFGLNDKYYFYFIRL